MPNVNAQFGGQTLILPGAYYQDDVSAATPTNLAAVPPMVFVGYAQGMQPKVPQQFASPSDLLAAMRGGPAAAFMPFIINPSSQENGAGPITFVNVGSNTQSSLTVKSSGTNVVTLTSADYGLPSNLLSLNMSAASGPAGAVAVTLHDNYSRANYYSDNIGVPFTLTYTGTATGAVTYAVAGVTGGTSAALSGTTASSMTLTSPNVSENAVIPLGPSGYATVGDVVNFINGTGFYTATLVSDSTLPAAAMDVRSTTSVPPASGGTTALVTAYVGDFVWWVNTRGNRLATAAAIAPGSFLTGGQFQFSGATSVPPILSDYAAGFNAALTVPGWAVIADSNSTGVQALGAQHAVQASSIPERKWRRFVTGSSIGETVATASANAIGLNEKECTYCYPGIYRTNTTTGVNTLYSGLYVAAAVAAIMSGNPVPEPLTSKSLVGNGLEFNLTTSQINNLQGAGVLPLRIPPATRVPTIVSDLTTWQNDVNPENVFNQQIACRQYLSYAMQQTLEQYVGRIASPYGIARVRNAVVALLNDEIYSPGGNGVLSSWDKTSLKLIYTGQNQLLAVQVSVTFVGQIRFITIYVPVQPLNLTA